LVDVYVDMLSLAGQQAQPLPVYGTSRGHQNAAGLKLPDACAAE